MSNGIFGIGMSGLAAAQAGLATTSHNISNVNTPGYSRQQTIQSTRAAQFTGSGYIGTGVDVTSVRRIYSDYLTTQARQAQADASQVDVYHAQLAQLDSLLGDSTSGLTPALSEFFAGVNALAAHPADVPTRQTLLSAAQAMVGRFNQLDAQLSEIRAGANSQLANTIATINAQTTEIARLNQQIALAIGNSGGTQVPNDLIDKRDAALVELNKLTGATTVAQSDGSVNVFMASGQALVIGQQAATLAAVPGNEDPLNVDIGLATAGGLVPLRTADFQGGALAGLLAFRDNDLANAQNALGRVASVLANSFNDQHALGQDQNGQLGGAFFAAPAPRVQNALANTGTANLTVGVASASALTTSDYRLKFDGSNYTLTRLSDNTQQTFAALPQTIDGLTIAVGGGAPAAGDTFLIQPTRYAARDIGVALTDTSRIAAAAPVRTAAATANRGSGSISAGSVDIGYLATPLAATLTLAYDSATGKFSGFPATQAVTVTSGGSSTTYAAGTPVPYTAGATMTFGGISVVVSGAPANGDTFTVAPNAGGTGDNRNAVLLAALQGTNLAANRTATLQGAYGQLVSAIGNATHAAQIQNDVQATLLTQAQTAQQAVSGVNLDEEAANLERYQQAYQAAGKMMAVAATLFDTILKIVN